jgi:toxin ParE1/3/4
MSAREPVIRLGRRAQRDIESLLLYTQRTWGEARRTISKRAIDDGLGIIQEHPMSGRPRDALFPGCRSILVQQHVIYYHQPKANEIVVLRVLHKRQNADSAVVELSE